MISGMSSAQFSEQLVAADRMGKDQLYSNKLSSSNLKLDAYKMLETSLDKISSKLGKIDGESFEKKTASISDDNASITVDPSAPKGNYDLYVEQLAQAQQLSATFDSEDALLSGSEWTSGTFSIQVGSDVTDIVTLDLADLNADGTMTVADLRDKINSHSDNPGVTASLMRTGDDVKLLLTSNDSGVDNTLDVKLGGSAYVMDEPRVAQDAKIKLNGVSITSSSNYLEDVIDGISIELNQAHEVGKSSTIKVESDFESSKDSVTDFVDSFNEFMDKLNQLTRSMGTTVLDETSSTSSSSSSDDNDDEEDEFKTTAVSEDQIGALKGDSSLRMLQSNMRNVMFQTAPNGMRLADIGIEINRSGKLDIDKDKLSEALKNDPDAVKAMFSDTDSYVDQLEAITKPFTQTAGLLDMKEDNLTTQIKRIEDDMSQHDYRMKQKYNIYLAQFTAMEATINSLSAASSLFYQGS
ncbi:flagellar filament capping protein FliD [Shewanella surugensis]|uniref:Flagellar hook-associated protein 2 n=1 Tax=Shewanella surugensis TaxID=212020 RepID=A0ABT0LFR3_9GAMM|nr:flagellar filament capping protein FliD [Shewanella surugensis]MCL1126508.1 flagellar filament capping protein FliD [Shewanella surugensis]